MTPLDYILLIKAEDVTDHILMLVGNCVEDWFAPGRGVIDEGEFIDRLCMGYGNTDEPPWDIEKIDTPAVRKILKHARAVRRELV